MLGIRLAGPAAGSCACHLPAGASAAHEAGSGTQHTASIQPMYVASLLLLLVLLLLQGAAATLCGAFTAATNPKHRQAPRPGEPGPLSGATTRKRTA